MPPFGLSPYPRGPRSSPGYSVPVHQHLLDPIRATGKTVPTSRLCGYTKRLSCAGAPRPPTSGSELSLHNPSRHVAFFDSGEISDCIHPVPSSLTLPSHSTKTLGFPNIPTNPFHVGSDFGASQQFACTTTCRFVRPPDGSDSAFALPARTFTSRLSSELSPDSDAGYGYRGNWTISTGRTFTDWICS